MRGFVHLSHWSVETLSGQMTRLTSSSRISAAVPGSGQARFLAVA